MKLSKLEFFVKARRLKLSIFLLVISFAQQYIVINVQDVFVMKGFYSFLAFISGLGFVSIFFTDIYKKTKSSKYFDFLFKSLRISLKLNLFLFILFFILTFFVNYLNVSSLLKEMLYGFKFVLPGLVFSTSQYLKENKV